MVALVKIADDCVDTAIVPIIDWTVLESFIPEFFLQGPEMQLPSQPEWERWLWMLICRFD